MLGPKTACSSANEMYTDTKNQHVCACIQTYSTLLHRYTAQTCTKLASNFLTVVRVSNIHVYTWVTKIEGKGRHKQVFEFVSAYADAHTGIGF